jgi:hypothetical protein
MTKISSTVDIRPTIVSLAGIHPAFKKPIDGKDLTPLIFQKSPSWENRLVFNHWSGKTSVRSEKYRLDSDHRLYAMDSDPGQEQDLGRQFPEIRDSLIRAGNIWQAEVVPDAETAKERPYPLGHPDYVYTQLPARDGVPHGAVIRSNPYPNCSYFTQWQTKSDFMSWDVEVLEAGNFEVALYYTCSAMDVGSVIQLSFRGSHIESRLGKANDPPLKGMENDRYPRMESYVKDFIPMKLGTIRLVKGSGQLTLKALDIPGREVAEVRLLLFKRIP